MATVQDHYDKILAEHYVWMAGGLEAALQAGADDIKSLDLALAPGRLAVDLGAGFGMHAIPLAKAGMRVIAIDLSNDLLAELSSASAGLDITCVRDDLLNFRAHVPGRADLVMCLGDTLPHLPDTQSVTRLFAEVFDGLGSGGTFVTAFRDYSKPLLGEKRFIPVRSTSQKIHTCFLEYGQKTVHVHDIFHIFDGKGWTMSVSGYDKLRLEPGWVGDRLAEAGFAICAVTNLGRMTAIVATRG